VPDTDERLQKFLARCGLGSRRACEELISQGAVQVNGQVVTTLGTRINPETDIINYLGRKVIPRALVYVVFNKPIGLLSSCRSNQGRTVVDHLRNRGVRERVFPVGRLDRDTEGLLLLTNDGELANRLMHPRGRIGKTYRALLDTPLAEIDREKLIAGIELEDGRTAPCRVENTSASKNGVYITIYEGKKRQVRRMFSALKYQVEELQRVRYGNLGLGKLKPGQYRRVSRALLMKLIGADEIISDGG